MLNTTHAIAHDSYGERYSEAMHVFAAGLLTALTTGIGALPFLFLADMKSSCLGFANAMAAGMMIGASWTLLREGWEHDVSNTHHGLLVGVILGILLMIMSKKFLEQHEFGAKSGNLQATGAKRVILVFGAMLFHSFAEGVSIGISFAGSDHLAKMVTSSLAVHNIPEGLAVSVVMVRNGTPVWRAAIWSVVTSLPQPLMAVPAFLCVAFFTGLLPIGLGFAAGAMTYVSLFELLPEARAEIKSDITVLILLLLSAAFMVCIT